MKNNPSFTPKNFLIDVDGVMTDGQFHYTVEGKIAKVFGPEDSDALNILKEMINIHFLSGDKRGFAISQKRIVEDMHFPLDLVSTFERISWIEEKFGLKDSIYMGDGLFDSIVFDKIGYSIAPANAFFKTKEYADFITNSRGAQGAVAEACLHIMEKFFTSFDPINFTAKKVGVWSKKI